MFCNFCGAEIEGGSAFCSKCGAKLKSPVKTIRQPERPPSNPARPSAGMGPSANTARPSAGVGPSARPTAQPERPPSNPARPMPGGSQFSKQMVNPQKQPISRAMIILVSVCAVLFLSVIGLVIYIVAGKDKGNENAGKNVAESISDEDKNAVGSVTEEEKPETPELTEEVTEKPTEEVTEKPTEEVTEEVKTASDDKADTAENKQASNGVELFEIRNGILVVEGALFGKSYDEVKARVESLGYNYSLAEPMDWEHSDREGVKSNYIDVDDRHSLGLYFFNDILVCIIYEEKGYDNLRELESRASSMYGALNTWEINDADTGELLEVYVDYNADSATVADSMKGTYSIFLNYYDDGTYTVFRDQQVFSTERYPGNYINPSYIYDFK